MADTNRDGISRLCLNLDALASSDSNSGLRHPTTNEPVAQKRTRSQRNVPDLVLRLPLSRSPLKDARKAHAKARGASQADLQPRTSRVSHSLTVEEELAGMDVVVERGTLEAVHRAEEEEEMDTCADERAQKYEEEEGSEDSLFSPASHGGKGHDEDSDPNQIRQTMWPTSTKKRPSPDTDVMRVISSPDGERRSKRAKVEAFRILGRRQEHLEYHEPLRDPDTSTPGRPKGHKRASSVKPTPSPSKLASSIFPLRAQSVPLGEENELRAIDFTSIPPSPRRSPTKGAVEIRRAPSVPPPDGERMDVDVDDAPALLQFTNPTHFATPRANPAFRYAVNFATPRGSATPPCSGFPFPSPPSPLTPLPLSPPTELTTSSSLTEVRLPPIAFKKENDAARAATVTGGSGQTKDVSSDNSDGTGIESTSAFADLSSAPSSRLDSNILPVSRPTVVGAMKPKRGPSVLQGSKRITRSVSMKEQRVKGDRVLMENTTIEGKGHMCGLLIPLTNKH